MLLDSRAFAGHTKRQLKRSRHVLDFTNIVKKTTKVTFNLKSHFFITLEMPKLAVHEFAYAVNYLPDIYLY
jgi:hypothetical protein